MKKRVLMTLVFMLLILNLSFMIITATNNTNNTATSNDTTITPIETDLSGVDKAFDCLKDAVEGKCSLLSFEEKVFTVLAIGKCKEELMTDSTNGECWPKSGCNVKDTALALWALNERGDDTSKAESWLFTQNGTPTEVSWFLEIEAQGASTCKITYSAAEYTIAINEDKIISSDAGSCLSRSVGNYWLRISPSCYDKEFQVSCNNDFLTTLLYKRQDSPVIHVSEDTESSSAEGKTTEKVDSVCFANGGNCDYEGSLWAASILDSRDTNYELSPYMPYLITMADQNEKLLPEMFLYSLTSHEDFRNVLLSKQRKSKYWDESGNKFYDTALALLPFSGSSITEKQGSINWLLEIQDDSGCFNNNNERDTAFLLYSLWLTKAPLEEQDVSAKPDCEASGKYCMSGADCGTANILTGYKCSALFKCCSVPKEEKTCEDMLGEICNSNEICAGASARKDNSAEDLSYGESCCIGGACEIGGGADENTCEDKGYTCRDSSCKSDEEPIPYETCDFASQTCCKKSTTTSETSYFWLWVVLILLIILIIVAIIFRNKLRPYWYKVSSKFGKGGKGSPPTSSLPQRPSSAFNRPIMRPTPGMRPGIRPSINPMQGRPMPQRGPMQKRTLPMNRPSPRITPRQKPRPELNNTLNRLRDMSKE